jgi:ribosomal protein S7
LFKFTNFEYFFQSTFDSKRPLIAFLKRKRAANRYEIPTYVRKSRSKALIVHWFIKSAKSRTEPFLIDRLYYEFIDFHNNVGRTIKKISEHYDTALKNRAFMDKFKKRYCKFRYLRRDKFGF